MRVKSLYIFPIILMFFLVSCVSIEEEPGNNPPIANAGEDVYCFSGETFTLDASGSEDLDGDSLEYKWTIGDNVYVRKELSGSFKSEGVYTAYLEVSDGIATDTDSVVITIEYKEEAKEEEEEKEEAEEEIDIGEEEEAEEEAAEEEAGEEVAEEEEQKDEDQTAYAGTFVGSINSDVYHYPWCGHAQKIKSYNEIWFDSVEDAKNHGYRPCKVCKPPG